MTALAQQETAARRAAAWFPLTDWTILEISGPDRLRFLHSFCTQDIKGMPADSVREAFVTSVKGRILGHLQVLNEAERLTLLTVPGAAAALMRHLQIYLLGLDAEIRDTTAERAAYCLTGPEVPTALATIAMTPPDTPDTARTQPGADGELILASVTFLRVPAWLVLSSRSAVAGIEHAFEQAGLTRIDEAVFDVIRIEAGFPWYGRDLSEDHIAQEAARTPRTISFTKGCYLGQEPIARLDAMGHTNRELRALRIEGQHKIPLNSDVQVDGKSIGTLTSVAASSTYGDTVALGVLKVKAATPGAIVQIPLADGSSHTGRVCWPEVDR